MRPTKSQLFLSLALTASASLLASSSLMAASVEELAKKCDQCHGTAGNSEDEKVPSIAGFSAVVIEDALTAFKEKERPADNYKTKSGEEKNMQQIAEKLDAAAIKAVSKYYASQSFKPRQQAADEKLAAEGAKIHKKNCEKCHSDGGTNADDDAAILAGQWRSYLERQVELLRSQERTAPKKMRKRFERLGDSDFKALLEFYASRK